MYFGRIRIGPVDDPVELSAGDFVTFDAAGTGVAALAGRQTVPEVVFDVEALDLVEFDIGVSWFGDYRPGYPPLGLGKSGGQIGARTGRGGPITRSTRCRHLTVRRLPEGDCVASLLDDDRVVPPPHDHLGPAGRACDRYQVARRDPFDTGARKRCGVANPASATVDENLARLILDSEHDAAVQPRSAWTPVGRDAWIWARAGIVVTRHFGPPLCGRRFRLNLVSQHKEARKRETTPVSHLLSINAPLVTTGPRLKRPPPAC